MFNKENFEAKFNRSMDDLRRAERVSKETIKELSRSVLEALHITGDIQYVNTFIGALSPMNKKTAVLYFKEFSGFKHDDALGLFTSKAKKKYDDAHAASLEFLADPHNNLWTWAERNIEMEKKEFDAERLNKMAKQLIDKATKNDFKQSDVLKALLANGMTLDTMLEVMQGMEGLEVNVQ